MSQPPSSSSSAVWLVPAMIPVRGRGTREATRVHGDGRAGRVEVVHDGGRVRGAWRRRGRSRVARVKIPWAVRVVGRGGHAMRGTTGAKGGRRAWSWSPHKGVAGWGRGRGWGGMWRGSRRVQAGR